MTENDEFGVCAASHHHPPDHNRGLLVCWIYQSRGGTQERHLQVSLLHTSHRGPVVGLSVPELENVIVLKLFMNLFFNFITGCFYL